MNLIQNFNQIHKILLTNISLINRIEESIYFVFSKDKENKITVFACAN